MTYVFFIECFVLETLLQATLKFYYNQTCINGILIVIGGNINGFDAPNSSLNDTHELKGEWTLQATKRNDIKIEREEWISQREEKK